MSCDGLVSDLLSPGETTQTWRGSTNEEPSLLATATKQPFDRPREEFDKGRLAAAFAFAAGVPAGTVTSGGAALAAAGTIDLTKDTASGPGLTKQEGAPTSTNTQAGGAQTSTAAAAASTTAALTVSETKEKNKKKKKRKLGTGPPPVIAPPPGAQIFERKFLKQHLAPVVKQLMSKTWKEWMNTNPFIGIITVHNAAAIGVPTYPSIVTEPMALEVVDARVQKEDYVCTEQFDYDVRLIISNAKLFNIKGETVYGLAEQLEQLYIGLKRRLEAAIADDMMLR